NSLTQYTGFRHYSVLHQFLTGPTARSNRSPSRRILLGAPAATRRRAGESLERGCVHRRDQRTRMTHVGGPIGLVRVTSREPSGGMLRSIRCPQAVAWAVEGRGA